jgi:predicted metal-binding protein
MTVTLHVCITCRAGQSLAEGEETPGARLHAAVLGVGVPEGVNVVPVECLSACSQGCSVALSAPGRWSYVYGRLSDANAREIVAGAAAYAAAADGIVPWRSRPEIFRKQSLARIPPIFSSLAAVPEAAE